MNRYQKPEIYQQLAAEYTLGTLQGRARKRFERLMEQHPFLQAEVEAQSLKFAGLNTLLPETRPPEQVWQAIEAQLGGEKPHISSRQQNTGGFLAGLFGSMAGGRWRVVAAVLSVLLIALFGGLQFAPEPEEASAYRAVLKSAQSQKPMADVQINKDEMKMVVRLKEPVAVPEGMKIVFWCIDKDPAKPYMNMGTLAPQGITEKKLKPSSWQDIVNASRFAVSIEPEDVADSTAPSQQLIFVGELVALKRL